MCVSFPSSLTAIQRRIGSGKKEESRKIIRIITLRSGWENIIFELAEE